MMIYIRGTHLAPQHQTGLSKYALGKYYPVDAEGTPIGKPFNRRWEIQVYHTAEGTPYHVVTGAVGKPRQHQPGEYDKLRYQNPERKAYLVEKTKERRAKKSTQEPN